MTRTLWGGGGGAMQSVSEVYGDRTASMFQIDPVHAHRVVPSSPIVVAVSNVECSEGVRRDVVWCRELGQRGGAPVTAV